MVNCPTKSVVITILEYSVVTPAVLSNLLLFVSSYEPEKEHEKEHSKLAQLSMWEKQNEVGLRLPVLQIENHNKKNVCNQNFYHSRLEYSFAFKTTNG